MNNNIKVIHLLVLIQVYDIAATSLAFKTVLEQLMKFLNRYPIFTLFVSSEFSKSSVVLLPSPPNYAPACYM